MPPQMAAACWNTMQPLLADCGAGVATHRSRGCGIVESLARAVEVDDGDGRRLRGGRRADERERREEPVQLSEDARRHGYFSS